MPVNNSVQIDSSAGTVTENFPALAMSAAGSGRQLIIICLNKYNALPTGSVSAITCTGTGVNATIANGQVVEIGVRQVAVESSFASICQAFHVADANLATLAENIAISTTVTDAPQHSQWIAVEVTDYNFTLDALTEIADTADVAANVDFTGSVTTTVANCLVIDAFATSHSALPTRAANQNLIEFVPNSNGAGMASWIVNATASTQVMTENLDQLHQRRAAKIISLSPAGPPASSPLLLLDA